MKKTNLPPQVKVYRRHWIDGDTNVPGSSRVMVDFDNVEKVQEHDGEGLSVRPGTRLSLITYHSGESLVVDAPFDQVVDAYVLSKKSKFPNVFN